MAHKQRLHRECQKNQMQYDKHLHWICNSKIFQIIYLKTIIFEKHGSKKLC